MSDRLHPAITRHPAYQLQLYIPFNPGNFVPLCLPWLALMLAGRQCVPQQHAA